MNRKVLVFFILVLLLSACGGEENSDAIQSPTDIPTAVTAPIQLGYLAENPVTRNADWTPVLQEFDDVAMVLVPAGCFRMGSTDEQIAAAIAECEATDSVAACNDILFSLEQPAAEICFETPFWIGRYEVTNAEYRECVAAGACAPMVTTTYYDDPHYADHPVVFVSWFQANEYAEWKGMRLPTEAEWEYAARGPEGWVYPWGNEFGADNVVYTGNSGEQTAAVGGSPGGMSWVGALDLSGNAREWVSTIFRSYPYQAGDGREDYNDARSDRVVRDGVFNGPAIYLRAASRDASNPARPIFDRGFRVARAWDNSFPPTGSPTTTTTTASAQLGYSAANPVTTNSQWTAVIQEFDGVEMVLVPTGCFRMGSNAGNSDEQPVKEQCFEEPFWIGRYEVTNAEYRECVEAGACTLPGDGVLTDATIYDDPNYANHPVIFVDWHQANDYAEWRGGRLPTEAEWEYAARGPDGLIYPWGNEIDATRVNFCDVNCRGYTWRDSNYDDGYAQTAPVGSYPGGVSWVGAYDLSGNIWEWISTIYQDYPYNATDGRESSLDAGSWRGWRGGAWYSTADLVRAGYRGRYVTTDRHHPAGIRIGRSFSPADIATAATTSNTSTTSYSPGGISANAGKTT